jgi:hypothetical protein
MVDMETPIIDVDDLEMELLALHIRALRGNLDDYDIVKKLEELIDYIVDEMDDA